MTKIPILTIFLILSVFSLYADILDIPEVKVYGERKVKVETINKQLLPFEKDYLEPSFNNIKKGLPLFEIQDEKKFKRNIGCRLEATAGTYLGGYLLGYTRGNFQPLEVGLNFIINSVAQDSTIQIFSRTSIENFYINASTYGKRISEPSYRFNIGNVHDIIDFNLYGIYSDSLIGVADINLKYNFLKLNLQLATPEDYNIKVLYEEYPLQAGIAWFDKKIYPELVYFLPFYDLYIKGALLNKTGIAYLYCQSLQYIHEYSSHNTYYRAEFGQSKNFLPISVIYSYYLNSSANYIGAKLTHKEIFFEFEYPIESENEYIMRAGISTTIQELIHANAYGYLNGTENYYIGADLGYDIGDYLRVGIEGDYIYGLTTENDFDIGGYIFVTF